MSFFFRRLGSDKYTSNSMTCPACFSTRAKFWEAIGPSVSRWRCKDCGQTWRYLRATAPPDMRDVQKSPSLLLGDPGVVSKQIAPIRRIKPIVGREKELCRKIAASKTS